MVIKTLDSDLYSAKMLDPDPNSMNPNMNTKTVEIYWIPGSGNATLNNIVYTYEYSQRIPYYTF